MATRSILLAVAMVALVHAARAQTAPGLSDDYEAPERDERTLQRLQAASQAADDRLVGGNALSPLPIREVTIFKDGNAFVLQQGRVKSDAQGQVVLGGLPSPVLGTFWPFAVDARLESATATYQSTVSLRSAQSVAELLRANVGAKILWAAVRGYGDNAKVERREATILSVPARADGAQAQSSSGNFGRFGGGDIILLQTEDGVQALPISTLQDVTFKSTPRLQTSDEAQSTALRLQLDAPNKESQVGVVYLQRDLRWIPNYRLQLGDGGKATMKLQATLINELANLRNVSARLAIGVPSFAFKDTLDPIALTPQARISPDFEAQFGGNFGGSGGFGSGGRSNRFSNAIQTQVSGAGYGLAQASPQPNDGPTVGEGAANEDFFLFDVKNLTLKKGERSVFPLAQSELKYQDIYAAQSPAAPPPQVYQSLNSEQQRQVLAATRAQFMHKLRVTNTGKQPLTTAPTLIERNGQLLAQTLMTYTATGGRSDIDLAPAVDITLKRAEDEVKRTPDALTYNDNKLARVDVSGKLSVTSFRNEAVTIEITRQFIGKVESAGTGNTRGEIRQVGAGDDAVADPAGGALSWTSYAGGDWRQANPISSVTWTLSLPAKSTLELPYTYFYFWR